MRPSTRDTGAATVEMAVLSIFLVLLVIGIVDVGRGIFNRLAIEDAAQAGASFAGIVETASVAQITARTVASIDLPDLTDAAKTTINVNCYEDTSGANRDLRLIEVEVIYDQDLITPVISIFTGPLRLSASAVAERFYDHPAGCIAGPIP